MEGKWQVIRLQSISGEMKRLACLSKVIVYSWDVWTLPLVYRVWQTGLWHKDFFYALYCLGNRLWKCPYSAMFRYTLTHVECQCWQCSLKMLQAPVVEIKGFVCMLEFFFWHAAYFCKAGTSSSNSSDVNPSYADWFPAQPVLCINPGSNRQITVNHH